MTRIEHAEKSGRRRALPFALIAMLVGVLTCGLVGCDDNALEFLGDDGSNEAKLEEARMAIDDAQYERAVDILLALHARSPQNGEVTAYLASALAAVAGLDTFSVLEILDTIGDSDYGEIEIVGRVLGDNTGFLTLAQVDEKLALLGEATALMRSIADANSDQRVQAGLFAVNHAVMTIARFIMADQGLIAIDLSIPGLAVIYQDVQATLGDVRGQDVLLAGLALDAIALTEAVLAVGEITGELDDNDLGSLFDDLQAALDPDRNGVVSIGDVENYINDI